MTDSPESPNREHETDDVLAQLASLPTPTLASETASRQQRRARAAFVRVSERAKHPLWDRLVRAYNVFEPVMAASVASVYLMWAFASAIALY